MDEVKRVLLLASSNPGKRREMQALLERLPLELRTQADFGETISVPETGSTYAENAQIKAATLSNHFGVWSLGDDSGLEVDALGGAPGLHSARLLAPGATDADRRARLLSLLEFEPRPWTARFRCVAALAGPDGELELAEGVCEGEIIAEERGAHGFGYDAIFKIAGMDRTMAELAPEEKNRLSHRARAIHALEPRIKELLGIGE